MNEIKKYSEYKSNLILEEIYGYNAIVYHRTDVKDIVQKIYTTGFRPGNGDLYGNAFYATYDLESQMNKRMFEEYGDIIVKFSCNVNGFLILDYDIFIKTELHKKLKTNNQDYVWKQLDYYGLKYDIDDVQDKLIHDDYTSELAIYCFRYIKDITYFIKGIIFTGKTDGRILISYDMNNIIPISYAIDNIKNYNKDGNFKKVTLKWSKTDKNEEYIKYLKTIFKSNNSKFIPIKNKLDKLGIKNYTIRKDGKIDVDGDVRFYDMALEKIPFNFGKVTGDFICMYNNLISLEGMPDWIGGYCKISNNKLKSLKHVSKYVGLGFDCSVNDLEDILYSPEHIDGYYNCSYNNIKTLENSIKFVGGDFVCYDNQILSLKNLPDFKGDLICYHNKLKDLEGLPKIFNGSIDVSFNELISLLGCSEIIKGNLNIKNNKLNYVKYIAKEIDGNLNCLFNSSRFHENDIRKISNIKGNIKTNGY